MENFFIHKNFVQKLIIAVVFILLFNFSSPTICNAESFVANAGGDLLAPVMEFFMTIFDGILNVLQTNLLPTNMSILQPAQSGDLTHPIIAHLQLAGALLLVAVGVVAVIGTGGALAPAVGNIVVAEGFKATVVAIGPEVSLHGAGILTGIAVAGASGVGAYYFGSKAHENFKGAFDVPTIVYTPFVIFAGMVPMFDINFFNPSSNQTQVVNLAEMFEGAKVGGNTGLSPALDDSNSGYGISLDSNGNLKYNGIDNPEVNDAAKVEFIKKSMTDTTSLTLKFMLYSAAAIDGYDEAGANKSINERKINLAEFKQDTDQVEKNITSWIDKGYVKLQGSAEEIYKNVKGNDHALLELMRQIASKNTGFSAQDIWEIMEANLFEYNWAENGREIVDNFDSLKQEVGETFEILVGKDGKGGIEKKYSPYYTYLKSQDERNESNQFAIDKSTANKLHSTVAAWYVNLRNLALVALLVILVYIGIRIIISSTAPEKAKYKEMIINWVVAICILALLHIIMIVILNVSETITKGLTNNCAENVLITLPNETVFADGSGEYKDENKLPNGTSLNTNFLGYIRYEAGIKISEDDSKFTAIGYILMYIMLVVQTCMFTWTYGKRVVYMAFLTIIAPLIAITYPIDKIGDGKSQAFDMWLKEYIFNALLQPVHLLIYTVLCGTAMDLMINSPIYGIIVLGFMIPAEKFIRKMFGFEKAQTPGALGGAAGIALATTGMQKLGNLIKTNGNDDKDDEKLPGIRMNNPSEAREESNLIGRGLKGARTAQNEDESNENSSVARSEQQETSGESGRTRIRMTRTPISAEEHTARGLEEDDDKLKESSNGPMPISGIPQEDDNEEQEELPANPPFIEHDEDEATTGQQNEEEAGNKGATQEEPPTIPTNEEQVEETGNRAPRESGRTGNQGEENNTHGASGETDDEFEQVEEDKKKRTRSNGERFYSALRELARAQERRASQHLTRRKIRRFRRRTARKLIGGAFGLGAGLTMAAAKMATGANVGDTINSSIAAGATGYALGSKGVQKSQEVLSAETGYDALTRGWYDAEEYRRRMNKRAIEAKKREPDYYRKFEEAGELFGFDPKEVMNSEFNEKCLRMGLDADQSINAYLMMQNDERFKRTFGHLKTEEQEAMARYYARTTSKNTDYYDPKKRDDFVKTKSAEIQNDDGFAERMNAARATEEAQSRAQYEEAQKEFNRRVQQEIDENNDSVLRALQDERRVYEEYLANLENQYGATEEELRSQIEEREKAIAKANEVANNAEVDYLSGVLNSASQANLQGQMEEDFKEAKNKIEDAISGMRKAKSEEQRKQFEAQREELERNYSELFDNLRAQDSALERAHKRMTESRRRATTLTTEQTTVKNDTDRMKSLKTSIEEIVEQQEEMLSSAYGTEVENVRKTRKEFEELHGMKDSDYAKKFATEIASNDWALHQAFSDGLGQL